MFREFKAKIDNLTGFFRNKKNSEKSRIDEKKAVAVCSNPILLGGFCAFYVAKDRCSSKTKCDRKRKLKTKQLITIYE